MNPGVSGITEVMVTLFRSPHFPNQLVLEEDHFKKYTSQVRAPLRYAAYMVDAAPQHSRLSTVFHSRHAFRCAVLKAHSASQYFPWESFLWGR